MTDLNFSSRRAFPDFQARFPRLLCCRVLFAVLVALNIVIFPGGSELLAFPTPQVRIGVLANWGVEKCVEDWSPMIRALKIALPDIDFILVPFSFEEVLAATVDEKVDFAVVNPSIYVNLEVNQDAIRIATLINQAAGKSTAKFGGVFFTQARRTDIKSFDQIRGKRLAATAATSLGGWLLGRYTLLQNDIDPDKDLASLNFYAAQDQVVLQVLEGKADVGTVRTDTLERLEASGKVRLDELKILTPPGYKPDSSFPYVCSTQLVPEWPFVKLKHTPEALAKSVAAALLLMTPPEGVKNTNGTQWTVPLPYESLREIMHQLRVPPYEHFGDVSWVDFIAQHLKMVIAILLMLLSLLLLLVYFRTLNRRLQMTMDQLRSAEIELTRQANTDGLTSLSNRKRFNEIIETEIRRALRYKRPLAMILMDLDHFKAINDKFGHPVGDKVLIALAGKIAASIRKGDVAARVGGEEFAVLLPETDIDAATNMAERIRAEVSAISLALEGDISVRCTISIGVADVCPSIQNHSALYTAADEALYAAKRQGRNRVERSSVCAWAAQASTS